LLLVTSAHAQIGQVIAEVWLEQEGRMISDPAIVALVETRAGEPLSMRDVRETTAHLMSLGRFEDVRAETAPAAGVGTGPGAGAGAGVGAGVAVGTVRLRYVLVPLHPVDRVEFHGTLGLPEPDLRRVVQDRFGRAPSAARQNDLLDTLRATYRRRGFAAARVTSRVEETHNPDRATLIVDIEAGPRAAIRSVQLIQVDRDERGPVPFTPLVREGRPYDADDVDQTLSDWVERMHGQGYYEARASHGALFPDNAYLTVSIARGPHVVIAFAGDPLPSSELDRLVPVRAEGSADEDLLEDSSRAIEGYLHARGYRDASVTYAPVETGGELTITFTIRRGPRYLLGAVNVAGTAGVPADEIRTALRLEKGRPFVQAALAAGAGTVEAMYRSRGYIRAQVRPITAVLPPTAPDAPDRTIDVTLGVVEGPRTLVRSVVFQGNTAVAEASLHAVITSGPGRVYSDADVAADRNLIDFEYRNRGFDSVVVAAATTMAEGDTAADVRFTIAEGPQAIVDDVIIVGNSRTSRATIERELLLRPDQPLGYSALIDSRSAIMALGLFSSVQIEPQGQPGAIRRDVIVRVEEADPTTIGGGGGLEGILLLRPTGESGSAEERFDIAPRGFFEIGRRNLWGKNRAVTLYTRVSVRSRDRVIRDGGVTSTNSSYGFHEYRVQTTFREPRIFGSSADVLFTASAEQALRSSFNFSRRVVRAEAGQRLSRTFSVAGRYSFERTKLFDDDSVSIGDRPLIDRLFPQVRLSKLAASLIRDSRDDILDSTSGQLLIVDGNVAARAIGSEVGYVSTYIQGFTFHRLPVRRQIVAALAGRIGVAHGFPRLVDNQIVQDLPASERFFAGGETTVRGFSLDRLGNAATITPSGFPTGGNGVVVLNAELRVALRRRFQAVGFLDAGNVFPRARDLDFTDLRTAAGFGGRFNADFALVRVDLGYNLDRRELVAGTRERGFVLHISLGQAF
jgi:outer membrane protein assembly factor BamA